MMKEKIKITPPPEEQESSLESQKNGLFSKYERLFEEDTILREMKESIENGWDNLDDKQQAKILKIADDFMTNLHEYHDSYINLKQSADEKRKLQIDDIEKYQAAVKSADEREHILHNTFMDSTNILSRNMKSAGLSNDWRGNSMIYDSSSPRGMRDKMRDWMFRIFGEEKR